MSNFATSIQQSGYAIGAFLEIAAEEFALSTLTTATFGGASEIQALRTLQLSSKIGKVINRTRELEKSLQGVSTVRKIFNSSVGRLINPLRETTNFALDFNKFRRVDELAFGAAKERQEQQQGVLVLFIEILECIMQVLQKQKLQWLL